MDAERRPILLTGMPRSGTTWVTRILTASGEVGHINEPFNLAVSPGTLRVPADHWFGPSAGTGPYRGSGFDSTPMSVTG